MSTISSLHESLPESDEVIFPVDNLIDGEPFYSNFTMIENFLQQQSNVEVNRFIFLLKKKMNESDRFLLLAGNFSSSSYFH